AYFAEDEQFYLVQEWVEGRTVAQVVQAQGSQREQTVIEMLTGLLNAIAFIHSKGIVHRDIKPDNIILRSQNNQPVLIDFGAVKETMNTVIDSANYSTRSIVVGTPGYMPVEQLSGRPVYASDIYSLGMTAIYMLTGKIPQEIESDPASGELMWHRYAPTVSARLAAVL
ncbi:MAG: serine/threonine-protein kinase, partial [Cyanobacteria bacterium J06560_5]